MAADVNVLREYLVSLGIKVDEEGAKKISTNLAGWDKQALALSTRLAGVATAAAAAVGIFSYQMEKLYFASKLSQSSANNLQSLEYGASRIGIKGMQSTVESIARTVRGNPGVTGLLNSFGIKVTGRDTSDVAKDLMHYLGQMSKFDTPRANAIGRIFGISEDDIYMWGKFEAEAKAAMADQQRMADMMGVNVDKAAEAGHEVINIWRELKQAGTLFAEGLAADSLPMLENMKVGAEEMMGSILRGIRMIRIASQNNDDWMKIQNDDLREMVGTLHLILMDWKAILATGDVLNRIKEGLGLKEPGGGVRLSEESKKRLGVGEADKDSYDVVDPKTGEHRTVKKRFLDKKFDQFMKWAGAKDYQDPLADERSVDAAQDTSAFKHGGSGRGLSPDDPRLTPDVRRKPYVQAPPDDASTQQKEAYLRKLEQQYNLPDGILDRTWQQESQRGNPKYMKSWAGAEGHFGFMPKTQKEYSLKNPYDFYQSADAAARKYSDLQNKYHDPRLMAGAYNGGDVMIDNYLKQRRLGGEGILAPETRDYMGKVGGGSGINQTNHITVNGSSDPKKAASEVAEQQRQVNSDLLRNNLTRVY